MTNALTRFAAGAALALGVAAGANASLWVQLDNNGVGPTVQCQDNTACDTNGLAGIVSVSTSFGTMTISLGGTGSGPPLLGPGNLDLTYNLTTGVGAPAGIYHVMVSMDGLSGNSQWTGTLGGTQNNGATTKMELFGDVANTLFSLATSLCGPSGPTSSSPGVALSCSGAPFAGGAAYSLTGIVTIVAKRGSTSATGDVLFQTPEPATLGLLGIALVGLAFSRRSKRA